MIFTILWRILRTLWVSPTNSVDSTSRIITLRMSPTLCEYVDFNHEVRTAQLRIRHFGLAFSWSVWESKRAFETNYLIQDSFESMNRLIHMLTFGKEIIKAVDWPNLLMWNPNYQGVSVKNVHLQLDAFKQFVQDGIKSTETILREQLFFGMNLPTVDLKEIDDVMGVIEPRYSFLKESADKLLKKHEFILNLMKSIDSSKYLIDEHGI